MSDLLSETYCEGWCSGGGKGKFPDCSGCAISKLEDAISEMSECLQEYLLDDFGDKMDNNDRAYINIILNKHKGK